MTPADRQLFDREANIEMIDPTITPTPQSLSLPPSPSTPNLIIVENSNDGLFNIFDPENVPPEEDLPPEGQSKRRRTNTDLQPNPEVDIQPDVQVSLPYMQEGPRVESRPLSSSDQPMPQYADNTNFTAPLSPTCSETKTGTQHLGLPPISIIKRPSRNASRYDNIYSPSTSYSSVDDSSHRYVSPYSERETTSYNSPPFYGSYNLMDTPSTSTMLPSMSGIDENFNQADNTFSNYNHLSFAAASAGPSTSAAWHQPELQTEQYNYPPANYFRSIGPEETYEMVSPRNLTPNPRRNVTATATTTTATVTDTGTTDATTTVTEALPAPIAFLGTAENPQPSTSFSTPPTNANFSAPSTSGLRGPLRSARPTGVGAARNLGRSSHLRGNHFSITGHFANIGISSRRKGKPRKLVLSTDLRGFIHLTNQEHLFKRRF